MGLNINRLAMRWQHLIQVGCRQVAEWRTWWWRRNFRNIKPVQQRVRISNEGNPLYGLLCTMYTRRYSLFVYIYVTEMRAPQWSSIDMNSNDTVLDLWLPSVSIRAQAAYYVHCVYGFHVVNAMCIGWNMKGGSTCALTLWWRASLH